MDLSEFDFSLPEELIAQKPAPERDQSRLMVVDRQSGEVLHDKFSSLPNYFKDRPLMVFNDTKVLPAKLEGRLKDHSRHIEFLLVREDSPCVWEALFKGIGSLKKGQKVVFGDGELEAEFIGKKEEAGLLRFPSSEELISAMEKFGRSPLPGYIKRGKNDGLDVIDRERYQTVYSRNTGAIAAPTAGLHFTPELIGNIASNHADMAWLTLHVGPGTFKPIRTANITDHQMEKEYFSVPTETWNLVNEAINKQQKILAVGSTTTRVLESLEFGSSKEKDVSGWTDRYIFPGQEFKIVSQMLTNFHLPKSTLYVLVCAFAGKELMNKAYKEAVRSEYRFFSYGDAMLIL